MTRATESQLVLAFVDDRFLGRVLREFSLQRQDYLKVERVRENEVLLSASSRQQALPIMRLLLSIDNKDFTIEALQFFFEPWENLIPAHKRRLVASMRDSGRYATAADASQMLSRVFHFPIEVVKVPLLNETASALLLFTHVEDAERLARALNDHDLYASETLLVYYQNHSAYRLPLRSHQRQTNPVGKPYSLRSKTLSPEQVAALFTASSEAMLLPPPAVAQKPMLPPPSLVRVATVETPSQPFEIIDIIRGDLPELRSHELSMKTSAAADRSGWDVYTLPGETAQQVANMLEALSQQAWAKMGVIVYFYSDGSVRPPPLRAPDAPDGAVGCAVSKPTGVEIIRKDIPKGKEKEVIETTNNSSNKRKRGEQPAVLDATDMDFSWIDMSSSNATRQTTTINGAWYRLFRFRFIPPSSSSSSSSTFTKDMVTEVCRSIETLVGTSIMESIVIRPMFNPPDCYCLYTTLAEVETVARLGWVPSFSGIIAVGKPIKCIIKYLVRPVLKPCISATIRP